MLFDGRYMPEIRRENVYFTSGGEPKLLIFDKLRKDDELIFENTQRILGMTLDLMETNLNVMSIVEFPLILRINALTSRYPKWRLSFLKEISYLKKIGNEEINEIN